LFLFYALTRTEWYRGALGYSGSSSVSAGSTGAAQTIGGQDGDDDDPSARVTWGDTFSTRFRTGVRLYAHAFLLFIGGVLMSFASYSTRDACLDFIFYFSVTSNSQTLSFPVATSINAFSAALFIAVAFVSRLYTQSVGDQSVTVVGTTEIFFLVAGLAMCALAQGAVSKIYVYPFVFPAVGGVLLSPPFVRVPAVHPTMLTRAHSLLSILFSFPTFPFPFSCRLSSTVVTASL
jgi:hypothetical protein